MSDHVQLREREVSGAEWIGSIPPSWALRPFFSVARQNRRVNKGMIETNLLSLSYGRIVGKDINANEGLLPESFETYQIVECDDMIFRLTDLQNDQRSLRTGRVTERGIITSAYVCVTPTGINPRFFAYVMRAADYRKVFYSRGDGLRQTLKYSDLKWLWVPCPPASEQEKIVKFIERETAKIDALIQKQGQLIRALRTRRSSAIEHGVASYARQVPTKASGLLWLGDVPSYWTVGNIRRFATMKTGHTPSRSVPEYWTDTTIPWITLADVWQLRGARSTYIQETASNISELGLQHSAAELLPAGTVVLSRTASVGFTGIMSEPMATSQDYWNWICGPRLLPEFLMYVFRAMRQEFNALSTGSTHKTIYKEDAASFRIPVPPIDEQREIIDRLDQETARIDTLIDKSERMIELSQERRAALITAAVTGQIGVAEMEPDEAAA